MTTRERLKEFTSRGWTIVSHGNGEWFSLNKEIRLEIGGKVMITSTRITQELADSINEVQSYDIFITREMLTQLANEYAEGEY